jgi:hypothetical protein
VVSVVALNLGPALGLGGRVLLEINFASFSAKSGITATYQAVV